jgi:hypothetical protein
MNLNTNRSYNCKDEELPVICRFLATSLRRDLADFTAYSHKLSTAYLADYEAKIAKVEELLSPVSETTEMKKITDRIHSGMNVLLDYVNQLGGYLEMAGSSIDLSATDFGLTALRKGIYNNDPEKVLDRLKDVNKNVVKYKAALAEQGFTDLLQAKLVNVYASLNADRQLQYEILTHRKALVQSNVGMLNDLNSQLTEVLRIGKILYRGKDAVKQQEYTLAELKKRVRRISKKEAGEPATAGVLQDK